MSTSRSAPSARWSPPTFAVDVLRSLTRLPKQLPSKLSPKPWVFLPRQWPPNLAGLSPFGSSLLTPPGRSQQQRHGARHPSRSPSATSYASCMSLDQHALPSDEKNVDFIRSGQEDRQNRNHPAVEAPNYFDAADHEYDDDSDSSCSSSSYGESGIDFFQRSHARDARRVRTRRAQCPAIVSLLTSLERSALSFLMR